MNGFQETVKNRIYSFNGQLLITKFSTDNSVEEVPFDINFDVFTKSKDLPYVDHVRSSPIKAGLVKTNDEILGVVLKGVGKSFDTAALRLTWLTEGLFIFLIPDIQTKLY